VSVAPPSLRLAVQGRARYTVPGLYGSEALKKRLEFRLGACEGIQEIAASTRTGNVLVRFQPDLSVEAVAVLLGNALAEHTNAIRSRNEAPGDSVSSNGSRPATPLTAASAVASRRTIRRAVVPAEEQREVAWHTMEAEAVAAALDTAQDAGLSHAAAQARLKHYGPNLPPEAVPRSGLSMLLEQFTSLPVALLGAAAGIALLTGGVADAMVIAGVVALNAAIGYVTESKAEQTIHALTSLVRPSTQVVRDGGLHTVRGEESCPAMC
jgi:P-type Ca2+ transporter type 2C